MKFGQKHGETHPKDTSMRRMRHTQKNLMSLRKIPFIQALSTQ